MGKQNSLSNKRKLELISDRKNGMKLKDLAAKYRKTMRCVSKIVNNGDKYLSLNKNQLKFKSIPQLK